MRRDGRWTRRCVRPLLVLDHLLCTATSEMRSLVLVREMSGDTGLSSFARARRPQPSDQHGSLENLVVIGVQFVELGL